MPNRTPQGVVVERRFNADEDACTRALKLLTQRTNTKNKAVRPGDDGGEEDPKKGVGNARV